MVGNHDGAKAYIYEAILILNKFLDFLKELKNF